MSDTRSQIINAATPTANALADRLKAISWEFADKGPSAVAVLEQRIKESARRLGFITYSDLVRGVEFRIPSLFQGRSYEINPYDWSGLDRRIVGDFLGYVSMRTYLNAGFLASTLVVNKSEFKPSDIFFEWMQTLGVLPDLREDTVLAFWTKHFNAALNWYRANPTRSALG